MAEKNYDGLILVKPDRTGNVQFGAVADDLSLVPLIESLLTNLQEKLNILPVNLCTYLALRITLSNLHPEENVFMSEESIADLKKAANILPKLNLLFSIPSILSIYTLHNTHHK